MIRCLFQLSEALTMESSGHNTRVPGAAGSRYLEQHSRLQHSAPQHRKELTLSLGALTTQSIIVALPTVSGRVLGMVRAVRRSTSPPALCSTVICTSRSEAMTIL